MISKAKLTPVLLAADINNLSVQGNEPLRTHYVLPVYIRLI